MRIDNETRSCFVELTVVDAEPDHYPSYRISIKMKTEELEGQFDRNIWLSEVDIDDFIERLQVLDKTRNGFEKLSSMSPDEFELGVKNIDGFGHLAVYLRLKRKPDPNHWNGSKLVLEFEIDPTSVSKIINGFRELKK